MKNGYEAGVETIKPPSTSLTLSLSLSPVARVHFCFFFSLPRLAPNDHGSFFRRPVYLPLPFDVSIHTWWMNYRAAAGGTSQTAIDIMAKEFPGSFAGYDLEVRDGLPTDTNHRRRVSPTVSVCWPPGWVDTNTVEGSRHAAGCDLFLGPMLSTKEEAIFALRTAFRFNLFGDTIFGVIK